MLSPSIEALTIGNCAERVDDDLGDERRVGQLRAGRARTRPSSSRAAALTRAEVHLEHRVHVRRGVRAEHHVLGDLLAHHRHRHDLDAVARLDTPGPAAAPGARPAPAAARAAPPRRPSMKPRMSLLGHAAADAGARGSARCRRCARARSAARAATISDAAGPPSTAVAPRCRRRRRPGRGAAGLAAAAACGLGGSGRRAACGAVWRGAGGAAVSPASPIDATTVLTGTVSPSLTLISVRTPAAGRRDLGVDLVGRDLEQRLVAVDRVADLLEPPDDGPFGDRLAHLRHHDVAWPCVLLSTPPSFFARGDDLVDVRQECRLERRAYGTGVSSERRGRSGASRYSNASSAMSAASSPPMPPVRVASCSSSDAAGLRDRRQDRLASSGARVRRSRTSACDAVGLEPRRRLERRVDHRAVGDDRQVVARAPDRALPMRHDVVLVRQVVLDPAVEVLVLEEEHRVVVADRRLEQALGVVGGRRLDHLEAGRVEEERLGVERVERPAADAAAARPADHHRHAGAVAVAARRGEVGEHVEAAGDEVDELHLARPAACP